MHRLIFLITHITAQEQNGKNYKSTDMYEEFGATLNKNM